MSPARRRTAAAQEALEGPSAGKCGPLIPDSVKYDHLPHPARPTCWHLFFPAKPSLPPYLRKLGKNGKPKRQPPRYPPNINERRAMHWTVERETVEYWRGMAKREAQRQGTMRGLGWARISAKVYRRALGVADASGDAERLKPLVDGLVDAGVLPSDTRLYVEYGPVEECRTSTTHRGDGILLIIEALEPASAARGAGPDGGEG